MRQGRVLPKTLHDILVLALWYVQGVLLMVSVFSMSTYEDIAWLRKETRLIDVHHALTTLSFGGQMRAPHDRCRYV
jgi:hypothetical protein